MTGFAGLYDKVRPLVERLDGFSLRERALVFGAGVAVLYVAWQSLLMDPLTVRAKAAEQHLADARRQMAMSEQIGAAAAHDPAVEAALRNGALAARLAALDSNLNSVAHGYVAPERMTELLVNRAAYDALLAGQDARRIAQDWRDELEKFQQTRQKYLLYK